MFLAGKNEFRLKQLKCFALQDRRSVNAKFIEIFTADYRKIFIIISKTSKINFSDGCFATQYFLAILIGIHVSRLEFFLLALGHF